MKKVYTCPSWLKWGLYYVPTTLKVRAMFKLLEMIGLCILFNASLHLFSNNWLIIGPLHRTRPSSQDILWCYIVWSCIRWTVACAPSVGDHTSTPPRLSSQLSSFHDKEFIKSFIKNLAKGRNLGISDDFPKEVEEMRKKLYPVLKAAKQEKRTAFFKVERLIIDGSLYRGPETIAFPLYGDLMDV